MSGVEFDADGSAAYGLMGYIGGISEKIKTPAYVNSVLRYTHAQLSYFFDLWMDSEAKSHPEMYSHVYEWPLGWEGDHPDYQETVGEPDHRLWEHTLTGSAANATASFKFTESMRPSPVNPILADEGVREGTHFFHFKAQAFEYAMPIEVTPKLAHYLAYVITGKQATGGDQDQGRHPNYPKDESGDVMFSKGPVNFTAGGGKFELKFTTAFILFYQTLAGDHMRNDILPRFEKDLTRTQRFNRAIKSFGKRSFTKKLNITAQASENEAAFEAARAQGIADLTADQADYIRMSLAKAERVHNV